MTGFFEATLGASGFADYCPNGLQVEGERPVRTLVSGVTASAALLRAAAALRADAVLVHHGWFWRGEDPRLVGVRRERARLALQSGVHLFGYHLPLDVHPELGNNAQLALRMGWRVDGGVRIFVCEAYHDEKESVCRANERRPAGPHKHLS